MVVIVVYGTLSLSGFILFHSIGIHYTVSFDCSDVVETLVPRTDHTDNQGGTR